VSSQNELQEQTSLYNVEPLYANKLFEKADMSQRLDTNKIDVDLSKKKSLALSRNKLIKSTEYLVNRRKTYDNQIKIPYCTAVFDSKKKNIVIKHI